MEAVYKCPNCNIILPNSQKSSHQKTCQSEDPFNLFTEVEDNQMIKNMYFNNNNNNNYQNFDTKIQKSGYDTPQINQNLEKDGTFICEICGECMENNLKKDHMFCHRLENEENITLENDIAIHNYLNKNDEHAFEDEEEDTSKYFDEFSKKQIEIEKKNNYFNMIKWVDKNKNIKKEILLYNNNKLTCKKIFIYDKEGNETYNKVIDYHIDDNEEEAEEEEDVRCIFIPPEENIPGMRYIIINRKGHRLDTEKNNSGYPEMEIEDINKIPKDKRTCNICLVEFVKKDKLTLLPCIHYFHSQCLKEWLKDKNVCPLCKLDLTKKLNTEFNTEM